MDGQRQILRMIIRFSWVFFVFAGFISFIMTEPIFSRGVIAGGLIVLANFHTLRMTLEKALKSDYLGSYSFVLIKYYVRFLISGIVILLLIQYKIVSPFGLFVGLSIVVLSIIVVAAIEVKKLIFKEAV